MLKIVILAAVLTCCMAAPSWDNSKEPTPLLQRPSPINPDIPSDPKPEEKITKITDPKEIAKHKREIDSHETPTVHFAPTLPPYPQKSVKTDEHNLSGNYSHEHHRQKRDHRNSPVPLPPPAATSGLGPHKDDKTHAPANPHTVVSPGPQKDDKTHAPANPHSYVPSGPHKDDRTQPSIANGPANPHSAVPPVVPPTGHRHRRDDLVVKNPKIEPLYVKDSSNKANEGTASPTPSTPTTLPKLQRQTRDITPGQDVKIQPLRPGDATQNDKKLSTFGSSASGQIGPIQTAPARHQRDITPVHDHKDPLQDQKCSRDPNSKCRSDALTGDHAATTPIAPVRPQTLPAINHAIQANTHSLPATQHSVSSNVKRDIPVPLVPKFSHPEESPKSDEKKDDDDSKEDEKKDKKDDSTKGDEKKLSEENKDKVQVEDLSQHKQKREDQSKQGATNVATPPSSTTAHPIFRHQPVPVAELFNKPKAQSAEN